MVNVDKYSMDAMANYFGTVTLPETNNKSENRPGPKGKETRFPTIFRCYVLTVSIREW